MKLKLNRTFWMSVGMLTAFVLWTAAVCTVDVQAIGPEGSAVGLATLNGLVHHLTGVHMTLYFITDWLSLLPFGVVAGFGVLGLVQWIQRRHLRKVDHSLLVLGNFYIVVMAVYVLFEVVAVNYRPILIDGVPEASYPSSTTMLVLCVMSTAILQLRRRLKNRMVRRWVVGVIIVFAAFMVVARLVSGVHWATDIVGGVLLSAGLVMMYKAVCHVADTARS